MESKLSMLGIGLRKKYVIWRYVVDLYVWAIHFFPKLKKLLKKAQATMYLSTVIREHTCMLIRL